MGVVSGVDTARKRSSLYIAPQLVRQYVRDRDQDLRDACSSSQIHLEVQEVLEGRSQPDARSPYKHIAALLDIRFKPRLQFTTLTSRSSQVCKSYSQVSSQITLFLSSSSYMRAQSGSLAE